MDNQNETKLTFEKNLYSKSIKNFVENIYWIRKLLSDVPLFSAWDKEGQIEDKSIQRFKKIAKDTNILQKLQVVYNDALKRGISCWTIKRTIGRDGKPTIFINAINSGVVRYVEFEDELLAVEVIERFTRGTIPIIRFSKYGKNLDELWYELEEGKSWEDYDDSDDLKFVKEKINNGKEIAQHNNGFVRAIPLVNRPLDGMWNFGKPELEGFEDILKAIDDIDNRLLLEIDQEGGHLNITYATGIAASLGKEEDVKKLKQQTIFDKKNGMLKVNYNSIDTQDNIDSIYIPANLNLEPLREEREARIKNLYEMLGIETDYDAKGTNDNKDMVARSGDASFQEATHKKNILSHFLNQTIEVIRKLDLDEHWSNVDKFEIVPKVVDYRIQLNTLNSIKDLKNIYTRAQLIEKIDGVSTADALLKASEKDETIKKSMSEFLNTTNNNPPQNLQFDGLSFATIKEPTQPNAGKDNNNVSRETKKGK